MGLELQIVSFEIDSTGQNLRNASDRTDEKSFIPNVI